MVENPIPRYCNAPFFLLRSVVPECFLSGIQARPELDPPIRYLKTGVLE